MLGDFASLARSRLPRVWSSLLKVKTAASGTPVKGVLEEMMHEVVEQRIDLTGLGSPGYFLLAIAKEKELESWRDIVSNVAMVCLVLREVSDRSAVEVVIGRSHVECVCVCMCVCVKGSRM